VKKFITIIALLVVAAYLGSLQDRLPPAHNWPAASGAHGADQVLADAFKNHRRNIEVEGVGRVVRILADDNEGTRHQKFIIQLDSGQELLVAHNIDLAERVPALRIGDTIQFRGEYEWNSQGGVLHWTHRDPERRHRDGWLKHNGRTYQ
jgi:Protein of unknown function (DUF3465)